MALAPGTKHTSRVRWADGRSVASPSLLLLPVARTEGIALEVRPDPEGGGFSAEDVGPGAWKLFLERRPGQGLVLRSFFATGSVEDVVVPISRRLQLVQLSERTCKWPNGDPLTEEFSFCGNDTAETGPYCTYHSRVAFQPAAERRRNR